MMSLSRHEAAHCLGIPVSEVVHVEDTDDGPVATTTDGVHTLIVDDELRVVAAPLPVPRNPATGQATAPDAALPPVPQADGTLSERQAPLSPDDPDACQHCHGTGRRADAAPPAGTVRTLPPQTVTTSASQVGDDEALPAGTAAEVLAWVDRGQDPASRARQALEAEEQREKPRAGLTVELQKRAQEQAD